MLRQQTRSLRYTSTVFSQRIPTNSASAFASSGVYGRSVVFPLPGIAALPFPPCPHPAFSSRPPYRDSRTFAAALDHGHSLQLCAKRSPTYFALNVKEGGLFPC